MSDLLESKQIIKHIQQSGAVLWDSVLQNASKTGDLDTLQLLSIQNKRTSLQVSCFGLACANGHKNIVNFFLEHLKQFQLYPQTHQTLIHSFCQRGLISASEGGHLDVVQMVIDYYEPSPDHVCAAWEKACFTCSWDVIFYLELIIRLQIWYRWR